MKTFTSIALFTSICFVIYIPDAFSQEKCPATIEGVKNNSMFEETHDDLLYRSHDRKLSCFYRESGKLKSETPFKNDKHEGIMKVYYENGKLAIEIPYKDDKAEGIAKQYYENGKLKVEVPYKYGKVEGITKQYYENGKLEVEMPYKDGKKEGQRKVYRDSGKLFATITYKSDSPINGLCHNINGTTRAWTNAEVTNWDNGLEVECN